MGTTTTPVTVSDTPLKDVDDLVYLGCVAPKNDGTVGVADVSHRINKAKQTLYKLNKICKSRI